MAKIVENGYIKGQILHGCHYFIIDLRPLKIRLGYDGDLYFATVNARNVWGLSDSKSLSIVLRNDSEI